MLTKEQKKTLLESLAEKISKMKSAVFADYTGLDVAKMTQLRRKLREQGIELKVAKKTLIDLAFKNQGIEGVDTKKMPGQIAVMMGFQDEVAPAKIAYAFGKANENLKILGGVLEGNVLDAAAVLDLAKLPSKKELLAKAVGSIGAPLSGMVNVLQGNLRGLVQVLSQIKPINK